MVALVIPVFNRPEYLKLCFESLMKLTRKPDLLVIVDDASSDQYTTDLIDFFIAAWKHQICPIWKSHNTGVKKSLISGIEMAIKLGATTIINLDSDAIVTPDFVERLIDIKESFAPERIVSGFNCVTDRNPMIAVHGDTCLKKYVNGINMCFSAIQYEAFIKPALLKEGNWDFNVSSFTNHGHVFAIPSCVQHIGMESSMGHSGNGQIPDTAQDFPAEYMPTHDRFPQPAMNPEIIITKPLYLPDVTLFGIDAHNKDGISRAAEISQRDIHFGAQKIITERLFPGTTMQEGRQNYSKFIIKELYKHFDTSHVLIIHPDGYVQNWKAWKDEWLEWDVVGATWSYKDNMNCGNGGFSLRSKKLCEILAKDPYIKEFHPEDCKIGRLYRPYLEDKYGIKFAPEHVCNEFSIEAYGASVFTDSSGKNAADYSGQFGFHGHHVRKLLIPMR